MEPIIYVKWDCGRAGATLNLEEFFPTTGTRIRKLFNSLIYLDDDWKNQQGNSSTIVQYLTEQVQSYSDETELRRLANEAADFGTKAAELTEKVNACASTIEWLKERKKLLKRGSRGKTEAQRQISQKKEELGTLKTKLSFANTGKRTAIQDFKKRQRLSIRYQKNLDAVKKMVRT